MQRTKRFVGEVIELSRDCELGQESDRAVVTSLAFPYMSLTFPDREPDLRVVHTGADYKYLRTYGGTVNGSNVDLVPALSELRVNLTAEEISALPDVLDHVRVHMAHHYPWRIRDASMTAIGKLVAAAKDSKHLTGCGNL
jgi:hypothetical protein